MDDLQFCLFVFQRRQSYVGFFIFPDYGISIDEDNTRVNGFVSLKYIFEIFFPEHIPAIDKFTNIPSMNQFKEQGVGVVFDLPAAFLELFFQIEDSRGFYVIRHLLNFLFFLLLAFCQLVLLSKFCLLHSDFDQHLSFL